MSATALLSPLNLGWTGGTSTRQWSRPENLNRIHECRFDRIRAGLLHGERAVTWLEAEQKIQQLPGLRDNWDSYGGQPPSWEVIRYAMAELNSLKAMQVELAPTISPSGDGKLLASWSASGIEIELWFEGPYQEMLLIEDDRGELEPFAGPDPLLFHTTLALRKMQSRV